MSGLLEYCLYSVQLQDLKTKLEIPVVIGTLVAGFRILQQGGGCCCRFPLTPALFWPMSKTELRATLGRRNLVSVDGARQGRHLECLFEKF